MTFEQFATKYMAERMLSDNTINVIIERLHQEETMIGRWNDNMDDYPEVIAVTFSMIINSTVINWIEQEKPKAWFKPFFINET